VLQVLSPRFGSAVGEVSVEEGKEVQVELRLDLSVHREEVVVTASPDARSLSNIARPVAVLDGSDLTERMQPTLGDTLAQEPGVTATTYAPGTSRPVIRGLGGDRIRILEDGIGAGDASNVSPDHAVSIDPLSSDRIEVVRGPATLLYGGNAIGGVVNVLDRRIPDRRPEHAVGGSLSLRAGSAAEERAGALALDGGVGMLGWHVEGLKRETEDMDAGDGLTIANSDLETDGAAVGLSLIGDPGFVGVSYSGFDTNYGAAVEEEVRIDLEQRRIDLLGEYSEPFGPFRSARVRLGSSDYEHTEFEGSEVGTVFNNKSNEGRVELRHKQLGPFLGSFGVQAFDRDFEAIGEEAFVQPTTTQGQALFGFEEIGRGPLTWELGARLEGQDVESSDAALRDRSFDTLSASAGLVWRKDEAWGVSAALTHSERPPTAEELYSNGPHIATNAFEVGDDDLQEETGLGLDVSLRKLAGRFSGEIDLFVTRFDGFIFDQDTGAIFDPGGEELPIFQYVQEDAEFYGAEAHLDVELYHAEPHHVQLELRGDYVHAELDDTGEPLPRIPPLRGAVAVHYQGARLWGYIEAMRVQEQDRTAPLETETPGHTLLGATLGYRLLAGQTVHELILRGTNLTDELAFNHVSRFKEIVPLPGRDVSLAYRLLF
jgi:iron complex outermembrane receptor protein